MERIDKRQLVMLIIIIMLIFLIPAIWLIINFTLLKPLEKLSDSINFTHSFIDVKNFVALLDELNACSSYIDLPNIVIPKTVLTFDIESRCVNAQCLPMSVLIFIENCIKHGTYNAYLHIKITAKIIAGLDKKEQLWITIMIQ